MSRFVYNIYVYRSCILILLINGVHNSYPSMSTERTLLYIKRAYVLKVDSGAIWYVITSFSPCPVCSSSRPTGSWTRQVRHACGFLSVIRAYKDTNTPMSPSVPAACITGNRVSLKRMADYSESRLQAWPFHWMATPFFIMPWPAW